MNHVMELQIESVVQSIVEAAKSERENEVFDEQKFIAYVNRVVCGIVKEAEDQKLDGELLSYSQVGSIYDIFEGLLILHKDKVISKTREVTVDRQGRVTLNFEFGGRPFDLNFLLELSKDSITVGIENLRQETRRGFEISDSHLKGMENHNAITKKLKEEDEASN